MFDGTLPQTTSGGGTRTFDAEHRLTGAATHTGGVTQWQYYAYDGDGRRIVRQVNGAATWQVTGFGGELLAEYAAASVTILPQKEYGYHGGQLLITASSGDENRLRRFVENIYYRTWGYLPTGGKRQANINALVTALGQSGQSNQVAMLQEAQAQLAAAFDHDNYRGGQRTNEQYVADLYLAYLQRPPESQAVLTAWANCLAANSSTPLTRSQMRQEFANSGEFAWLVNALYGEQSGDYDRVDRFAAQTYLAATGSLPGSSQTTSERNRCDTAEAQGVTAMQEAGKELGRYLLGATPHDAQGNNLPYPYRSDLPTQEYVRRLYETFLRRTPDTNATNWQTQADNPSLGRGYVLEQFLGLSAYAERSAALYREIQWLIPDHLGTPRFIVERTGSAAGVKRNDYLPFGESANTLGGRTAGHGYGGESLRQGFTGYEADAETGLDYAQARYYASAQGRFVSVDPLLASGQPDAPQSWNRYTYCFNNPLNVIDPSGLMGDDPWSLLTKNEQELVGSRLNRRITQKEVEIEIGGKKQKVMFPVFESSQEVFNRLVGGNEITEETYYRTLTVTNFLLSIGAHQNSEQWQEISSIDSVWESLGEGKAGWGLTVTVYDSQKFFAQDGPLANNGYEIENAPTNALSKMVTGIFGGHANDSARQTTKWSFQPGLHLANDDTAHPNMVFVHWDWRSSSFTTRSKSHITHKDEQAFTGLSHWTSHPHTPLQIRSRLSYWSIGGLKPWSPSKKVK